MPGYGAHWKETEYLLNILIFLFLFCFFVFCCCFFFFFGGGGGGGGGATQLFLFLNRLCIYDRLVS